ncbi:MAG TPA: transglutaminase domain-containing protein [Kineosporiaceae bacterium]|nr:transglutaminase domain-containing protein [Kineosporiaceae bacterium]
MPSLDTYTQQSPYSDPREYTPLITALPADLPNLGAAVRNVLVHYRAPGVQLSSERLAEIDNRWIDRLLAADRSRFDSPLDQPRPEAERVAGCCRDFTLLTVSALRAHGVPARSRIGFAAYFEPDFHDDHVITEFWDGERWVFADTQLAPTGSWPGFDPLDMVLDEAGFTTAAQVWTAYRRGDIDANQYGVGSGVPIGGAWFVRNYVLLELAHRQRDELLLWDLWGGMSDQLNGDLELIDEVAALLLAADGGDQSAEATLAERYATDARLHPGDRVLCRSPRGVTGTVDLRGRAPVEVSAS